MTVQEAIKELQVGYLGDTEKIVQAKHMGIMALEKQIPKKPIDRCMFMECPTCNEIEIAGCGYCPSCGQKLDWEEGGTDD